MSSTSFARSEVVENLVRDASMAPSMHNAQPWRFQYSRAGDSITLRADPERAMPHADPQLRALHLGCGAALFNLRVAAQHAGFRPVVTTLPDPDDWQILAHVSLRESAGTIDPGLAALHTAIAERRTSRRPFDERPIPDELADRLVAQARAEGGRLAFLSGWHLSLVLDVIEEAELSSAHSGDPDEQRWVRTGVKLSDAATDGIPETGFGPRRSDGRAPVRDFARGRSETGDAGPGTAAFEHMPLLGLLCTEHDHPSDWLAAGQAMERTLLTATREGLATSFATQALERSELRWLLRDPVWGAGPVQMVIRLGYGPLGRPTPRRPVREVLEVVQ
ncbi:nitroreductase [Streptomyces bathyalis]|uniref:Nitroreductase n=1 Tax=Streptomyces bathyalis TaxID=2710756 RepID=A0A7T1T8K8_9ACTN|nr:nitroreductase family protein [Streptomyces bathyalis]QPP08362.1 nitroreductase [Streptomyces bathyalis]